MSQTIELLNSLKKCLKARGKTYRDVAQALGISEASVRRIFSKHTFTLDRLEQICRYLDMSVYDLARITKIGMDENVTKLTLAQERALVADRPALTYFYLLLTGRTPEKIAKEFGLTGKQQNSLLVRLSRIKVVELLPKSSGRLLTSRRIEWHRDGPIRKAFQKQVTESFMDSGFDDTNQQFSFDTGELSDASVKVLLRKIDRLSQEFDELADLDISLAANKKKAVGMMIGIRPWAYWSVLEPTANDMGLNVERSQAN